MFAKGKFSGAQVKENASEADSGIEEEIEDEVHELFPGSPRSKLEASGLDKNKQFEIPVDLNIDNLKL